MAAEVTIESLQADKAALEARLEENHDAFMELGEMVIKVGIEAARLQAMNSHLTTELEAANREVFIGARLRGEVAAMLKDREIAAGIDRITARVAAEAAEAKEAANA